VTGRAAIHVNPHRIDDLAEALYLICTDKELREELSIRGPARAQKFEWDKTTKKTLELLEKTARNN
jgi:glycosyltransferase involved in cell wall biosynthesis